MKKPWCYWFIGFLLLGMLGAGLEGEGVLPNAAANTAMTVGAVGSLITGAVGYAKGADLRAESRARNAAKNAEMVERRAAEKAEKEAEKAERAKVKAAKRDAEIAQYAKEAEKKRKAKQPVAAVIVTSKSSVSGNAGKAVIGGMLMGPLGAVAGASGKRTSTTESVTFSVKYADGHTGLETVTTYSKRFKELAALLVK